MNVVDIIIRRNIPISSEKK